MGYYRAAGEKSGKKPAKFILTKKIKKILKVVHSGIRFG
jgi:hypothetical protein